MTSEVLILNKRGMIVAADSAVTSRGGQHPRYSKSATKIFELTKTGTIAAAIFGSASIDLVPWEIVFKLFRAQLGATTFETVAAYADEFLRFLERNESLFPPAVRVALDEKQFDEASVLILEESKKRVPCAFDLSLSVEERRTHWNAAAQLIRDQVGEHADPKSPVQEQLTVVLADLDSWEARAAISLQGFPNLDGVCARDLAEIAHRVRHLMPSAVLSNTGLVFAGFGEGQIFPAYRQISIYGHVGSVLVKSLAEKIGQVTHTESSIILSFAQTSMIDVFTDGFGASLFDIIKRTSLATFGQVFQDLMSRGVAVPEPVAREITGQLHEQFMKAWMHENFNQNYHPLLDVISTLSIEEMAHLAETLLVLESLKERVTSPSESVGGPIDVAAITKSEGLVWIKRKHYFDAALNMRYASRLHSSYSA